LNIGSKLKNLLITSVFPAPEFKLPDGWKAYQSGQTRKKIKQHILSIIQYSILDHFQNIHHDTIPHQIVSLKISSLSLMLTSYSSSYCTMNCSLAFRFLPSSGKSNSSEFHQLSALLEWYKKKPLTMYDNINIEMNESLCWWCWE